jgi:GT2 family glycosyltransferase
LGECLRSAIAADGLDELIIVDNGNPKEEAEEIDRIAASDGRVQVIRGQGNVGFGAACNLGARAAQSEVLAFVNPDVILRPEALTRLADALPSVPAIIGGDLRDEIGAPMRGARRERLTIWRAAVSFTGLSRLENFSSALKDFNRDHDPLPARSVEVGAISGALFATRKMDYEKLGGFDEGYFLHVEDVDLCRRAADAGWSVLFLPGPHGMHFGSTSDAPAREVALHKARGFARYFQKFARSPFEHLLGSLAGQLLLLMLPLAARR